MPCKKDWVNTVCPKCNTAQNLYVYKVAEISEEPEVRERLYRGEINIFKCVKCNAPLHYDEYMIYSDRERGLLVNVFSKDYQANTATLVRRLFEEVSVLPPDGALPNLIVFGFHNLARILALMERQLEEKSPAERSVLASEDYQKLFMMSEGWKNLMEVPGYEKSFQEAEGRFQDAAYYLKEKRFDLARDAYLRVLECCPEFFEANLNLGLLYCNEFNDPGSALSRFEKCRELRPNDGDVHFSLGQLYLKRKDMDSAITSFYRALLLTPQSGLAWFNLGLGLCMMNQKEDGLEKLEKSLTLTANQDDRNIISRTILNVMDKI
jgi:tetratricopeptide (TPR) repeat protein